MAPFLQVVWNGALMGLQVYAASELGAHTKGTLGSTLE